MKNHHTILAFLAGLGLALGILVGLGVVSAPQVGAQTPPALDLSVSPPTTYLWIKPGQTLTHTVTLEQKGRLPVTIIPSVVDFQADGTTGQPILNKNSTFKYLSLATPTGNTTTTGTDANSSFTLQPNQAKKLTFTLNIPADAREAEYPLTLLFTAQPTSEFTLSQTGSTVSGVVGSNLIVLISNTDRDRGELSVKEIQTPQWIDSFRSLSFKVLAENTGHNATTASGSAVITDWQGKQVAQFPIYPDMVLAGSTRLVRTSPTTDLDLASGFTPPDLTTIDPALLTSQFIFDQPFLIGPYTIAVYLTKFDQNLASVTPVTTTVVALPYTLVILLILGVGMYTGFLYWQTQARAKSVTRG